MLASAIATDDNTLNLAIRLGPDFIRMPAYNFSNDLRLETRNPFLELIEELDADLLYTGQEIPPVFNDVVKIPPTTVVVEIPSGLRPNSPNPIERVQNTQDGIGFQRIRRSNISVVVGMVTATMLLEFREEICDFCFTTW
jgi:hypothetical protein